MVASNIINSRTIRDLDGNVWQITESLAHDVPGAMAPSCLIFDSQSVCRRYWAYPANWSAFDDEQLLELMSRPHLSPC